MIIKDADSFDNVIRERKKKSDKKQVNGDLLKDSSPKIDHRFAANALLKTIQVIKMDHTIKKVLTMRIVGPLMSGKERSHTSIALELGIPEDEIREIEFAGITILDKYLQKVTSSEFIEKFNQEKKLKEAIDRELGKSHNGKSKTKE